MNDFAVDESDRGKGIRISGKRRRQTKERPSRKDTVQFRDAPHRHTDRSAQNQKNSIVRVFKSEQGATARNLLPASRCLECADEPYGDLQSVISGIIHRTVMPKLDRLGCDHYHSYL